jgi:quinol monooxygenase YgiN
MTHGHAAGMRGRTDRSLLSQGSIWMSVKIVAILSARSGKAEELKALLMGMLAPCRAEPGNLRWDIWQDQADPGRLVLDELYTDNAAVAAHRATSHFQSLFCRNW